MQMQFFIYDANVPCRDENAKFIHDDASAHIYTIMQISPCKDGDARVLGYRCLLMGISWCECPLVGMQECKCPNTNYSKIPFIFKIKAFLMPETKIFSNLDLLFPEKPSFFFYLRPLKIGDHC